jgi:16S rRNA (cytosine1402-N4)-methyltransferase
MTQVDEDHHAPVLATEVIEKLVHRRDGVYVDATFGRGGHSRAMLSRLSGHGRVVGIDCDHEAIASGDQLARLDARFQMLRGKFSGMAELLDAVGVSCADGVLMDIGVSSPQLDDQSRGFSFRLDGPLDMRMDQRQGLDAAQWLNDAETEAIASVLREFGEERFAKRIAEHIVRARPLSTTGELAKIISDAIPAGSRGKEKKHPATRSFQAIRIYVNDELTELERGMDAAWSLLNPGGRLAVIAFHSLEDRLVKRRIKGWSDPPELPRRLPIRGAGGPAPGRRVGRALRADALEQQANPRARSATLRVIEKWAERDA